MKNQRLIKRYLLMIIMALCLSITGCSSSGTTNEKETTQQSKEAIVKQSSEEIEQEDLAESQEEKISEQTETENIPRVTLDGIPQYSGVPYVEINGNVPYFTEEEKTTKVFENYSKLDSLGRCGVAYANICQELMPTEERGKIGMIKPSGWHTVKYNGLVDGNYLYNRCHLIGFQLAGENANEENLITGTRYLNVDGMLPFENEVADYVDRTNNHVLYRVTPIFEGENLLASGVLMEAYSVEDSGKGVSFNVYCYNVQPEIYIDYTTGDSSLGEGVKTSEDKVAPTGEEAKESTSKSDYVLNKNTKKFHYPSCSSVGTIKPKNREEYSGTRDELIKRGYDPCGRCHP